MLIPISTTYLHSFGSVQEKLIAASMVKPASDLLSGPLISGHVRIQMPFFQSNYM